MSGEVLLRAEGLAAAVDRRYVLLDLGLELRAGEVTAIAGENGAGKTTLLGLLAGERAPDRGTVRLAGVALAEADPAALASRIGVLGHRPGLYLELSAVENVVLFAALAGRPCTAAEALAHLQSVGLAAADAARPVRHYSRGMAQRAAIARLIASGATIWLLDEPSTGLDRQGCATLRALLRDAADQGRALCVVSHDPELLAAADRRLELRGGQLHDAGGA
ncbi:MAG: ABC transporter ATP-binding protein [Deltaproteobacteria bacterium]|nr:ABC transporter ATP-binding protein [Deltaproteobacteria bacterium]